MAVASSDGRPCGAGPRASSRSRRANHVATANMPSRVTPALPTNHHVAAAPGAPATNQSSAPVAITARPMTRPRAPRPTNVDTPPTRNTTDATTLMADPARSGRRAPVQPRRRRRREVRRAWDPRVRTEPGRSRTPSVARPRGTRSGRLAREGSRRGGTSRSSRRGAGETVPGPRAAARSPAGSRLRSAQDRERDEGERHEVPREAIDPRTAHQADQQGDREVARDTGDQDPDPEFHR